MHGDFSRGHRPDRKRNQTYLRAFAQERRLLLDSDLNAATDALHERLRGLANHLGCPKGSPDLGYLVTPGRLLALFRDLDEVVVSAANMTFHRDYMTKYLDRYPSLHLLADQGAQGTIRLRFREPVNGNVRVWCRRDAAAVVNVGGAALAVPATATLTPANVAINAQEVDVTLDAGGEIWIGLIETFQAATLAPHFDYAGGHYYLDGLPLENPADATWASINPADINNLPDAPFPVGGGNLALDNLVLAYLEGWERHITAVEDLGLLERALGGDTDTMTRGRAVGQVKLAFVPADFDLERFDRALASPVLTNGTLNLAAPLPDPDPNPCALPIQAGYTGLDNRLYRFEVHAGGAIGAAAIKWSRDNGSELFNVINAANDNELTFPSNTPLQGGDLVEIFTANSVDLGDALPAVLNGATDTFTPPVRSVGELARLVGPTANGGATFTLNNPNGVGVFHLPAHFGGFPATTLKVRRWHGLIDTSEVGLNPADVAIENGIRIALNGSYTPRDYWQLEVRAGGNNDNGPFQATPHGPERDFAPLALLRFADALQPLFLERWLDDRFVPICELTADDIAFDGDHIGSDSDTVQEIIEEIWERLGGGCCEFTVEPPQGDAAVPIRDILQDTQGEVTICLEPGVYTFTSALDINNRTVILKGCPRAVIIGGGPARIFNVIGTGRLVLDHLVVFSRQAGGTGVLVDLAATSTGLEVRDSALLVQPDVGVVVPAIAVRVNNAAPPAFDPALPNPPNPNAGGDRPSVRLYRALVAAGWGLSADGVTHFDVADSAFECVSGCVWIGDADQVEIQASTLIAGASLDAMAGWNVNGLLSGRDALLGALGDLFEVDLFQIPTASVALWLGNVQVGRIRDGYVLAGVALAVTESDFLDVQHTFCFGQHTGLHLVRTTNSNLHGLTVATFAGTAGVLAGRAQGLTIADCTCASFELGIGLGTLTTVSSRALISVHVQGNRLEDVGAGILVGPSSGAAYTGRLDQLAIAGNTVFASTAGIAVNAQPIGPPNASPLPVAVRISENIVTARQGIAVIGRDVEVADNVIRRPAGEAPFFGVIGVTTLGLVCTDNHIDAALNAASVAAPQSPNAVFLNVNAASVQPAAIIIAGGSGATVSGNVTHADAGLRLRSLSADNHSRLSVKGNEFLSGEVMCSNTDEVVFLDNTVTGLARVSGTDGGQVDDNRVFVNDLLKLDGDLEVLSATGRWKVSDNRADGVIRVIPTSIGRIFPGWFDRGFYNVGDFRALDNIGILAGDREFGNLIRHQPGTPPVVPPGGGGDPAPDVAPMAREAGGASYAMSNAAWREDYTRGIVSFVAAGANEALIDVIRDFGDIIIINGQREGAYQVQCTANWSRDLEVGIPIASVRTNATSTVQVVANRADEEMRVKAYTRLVMALNVASDYPLAGNSQTQAINQLNLEI